MTKTDILNLLKNIDDSTEVILYDGDDSIFTLSHYGSLGGQLWLKINFRTTVEDLD